MRAQLTLGAQTSFQQEVTAGLLACSLLRLLSISGQLVAGSRDAIDLWESTPLDENELTEVPHQRQVAR